MPLKSPPAEPDGVEPPGTRPGANLAAVMAPSCTFEVLIELSAIWMLVTALAAIVGFG